MAFETLDIQISDSVAIVTLNRLSVNAQKAALRLKVTRAFDIFNDREDARCVVLVRSISRACSSMLLRSDSCAIPCAWRT